MNIKANWLCVSKHESLNTDANKNPIITYTITLRLCDKTEVLYRTRKEDTWSFCTDDLTTGNSFVTGLYYDFSIVPLTNKSI